MYGRPPELIWRLSAMLLLSVAGCAPLFPGLPDDTVITITDVSGLEAPVVPQPRVYKPTDLRPLPATGEEFASFTVSFAAGTPEQLGIQLSTFDSQLELKQIEAPLPADFDAALQDERIVNLLIGGAPVFWLTDLTSREGAANILVPQALLTPATMMRLFVARGEDGTPLGSESISLARDFFYMSVIGDSVAWGNGLFDEHKYSRLVSDEIERRTGKKVIRQVHAISGASILPGPDPTICPVSCNGESQIAQTPILDQIDLITAPDQQDLILMDGCINDVTIGVIINPKTAPSDLVARTNHFCGDAMAQELAKVRTAAPQARLAVTGYYPIVGPTSDPPPLVRYLLLQGDTSPDGSFVETLAANSMTFVNTSSAALAANVASVNGGSVNGPVAVFVSPEFTPDHAVFTPDSWLWGLTGTRTIDPILGVDLDIFPEDENAALRAFACFEQQLVVSRQTCVYASLAHPNRIGASQFATHIIAGLETLGILPATP